MKKSLMLLGALMISTFIFAQNNAAGPRKGRVDRGETMKTVLSLDDAQYSSIKEINKKYDEQHHALRKDSTMKRDDKFEQHKKLNDQRQSEINKVLTPEQSSKWASFKKERADKRKAAFEKRVNEHDEKLRKELNLSDDQFKKLQDMHKRDHDKSRKRHGRK